jgi:hypothetical protein
MGESTENFVRGDRHYLENGGATASGRQEACPGNRLKTSAQR